MKTVKTSRDFHGPVISLRALCQLEDRPLPFSIRDVVTDDGIRVFSGSLSTGDVICTWRMVVWENGLWTVSADFHDGGTLAGDFFFAEFLLDKGLALGVKLEGSILNIVESRSLSLSKDGLDRRIRENWHLFEATGPSVRLHAAPSVAALVTAPLAALAAVPFAVFFVGIAVVIGVGVIGHLAAGGTYQMRPCRNPPPESKACLEIIPVGPPDPEQTPPGAGSSPQ